MKATVIIASLLLPAAQFPFALLLPVCSRDGAANGIAECDAVRETPTISGRVMKSSALLVILVLFFTVQAVMSSEPIDKGDCIIACRRLNESWSEWTRTPWCDAKCGAKSFISRIRSLFLKNG